MRRRIAAFAGIALVVVLAGSSHVPLGAAGGPVVKSIVEGHDSESDRIVLWIVGSGVKSLRSFTLTTPSGVFVSDEFETIFSSKTMIAVRLPASVGAGTFKIAMATSGSAAPEVRTLTLTAGRVPAGSVTAAALAPILRGDLDDADLLGGRRAQDYALASEILSAAGATMTGTLTVQTATTSVSAQTSGPAARAVVGRATDLAGQNAGVHGQSDSALGTGVLGTATSANGSGRGVQGDSAGLAGVGVAGSATSLSGATHGVRGSAVSPTGIGVGGYATAVSGSSVGVHGESAAPAGIGVEGWATQGTGNAWGVFGRSSSSSGTGVRGTATTASGSTVGVAGESASTSGTGVSGFASAATGTTVGVSGEVASDEGAGVVGVATSTSGLTYGVFGSASSSLADAVHGEATSATGAAYGVFGSSASSSGVGVFATCSGSGSSSVGLVANHSGATGSIAHFRSSGTTLARIDKTGKGFFNGGTQTGGADFAESVTVRPGEAKPEAGDVIVIDVTGRRRFALCAEPESPLVAGIVSTKPGLLACPYDVAEDGGSAVGEIPLAVSGIVPCKVSGEGGAIRTGDMLVAASKPGHAKRAPAAPAPGTVLGKALEPCDAETGRIEVLLTLR